MVGTLLWRLAAMLVATGLRRASLERTNRGYGLPWTLALVRGQGILPVISPQGSPHGNGLGRTPRYFVEGGMPGSHGLAGWSSVTRRRRGMLRGFTRWPPASSELADSGRRGRTAAAEAV
jgi:hypothetical protein